MNSLTSLTLVILSLTLAQAFSPEFRGSVLDVLNSHNNNNSLSREKRYVDFPKGSGIEMKWSLNFGFNTYTKYKSKIQLALPTFIGLPHKKVKEFKRSIASAIADTELQLSKQEAREERMKLYQMMESIISGLGHPGHDCMLRTICEVAEIPFEQGLLGDLINALLTASVTEYDDNEDDGIDLDEHDFYHHYVNAEQHGRQYSHCHIKYNTCRVSVLDLLPGLDHTILEVL